MPHTVPIILDVKLDPRVLLFTLAASLASALLFGLVPAWRASRTDLVPALKSGDENGARHKRLLGRNAMVIAQVAGSLLLLVVAMGLYGLMTYSVSRRTREIGIRMAIGADHLEVAGMVLRQGMLLAGVGVALGLALSLLLSHALTAALKVPSFNTVLLAIVPLALLAVAALGAYLPARRAALVDPLTVLRQD